MNILVTTSSFSAGGFPEDANVTYNPFGRKLTEDEAINLIEKYRPDGIVAGVEPLTRRVLESAKGLRVISRCGIGLDSVDLAAAKELGIAVCNTPDAPTSSVAEFALALMLCLARKVNILDAGIKAGGWKGPGGVLMKGRTVGLVGCGRIGTYVARLVSAFGCTVIGYDPFIKAHDVCKMVPLQELLQTADIISLHVPYTPENHHMLGVEQFEMMKPGAMLINVSRGGLVDEDALYDALVAKKLYGAGLDCFEQEPYNGKLIKLGNVLLAPHSGAAALEARMEMETEAVKNLLERLK